MWLVDNVLKIGGKLGVIKIVSTTAPAAPDKIPTRKVSLKELETEVRAQELNLLAQKPAELSVEFAKVFEAAGVKAPPHGWTVERLQQVLRSDRFKGLDRDGTQKALLELLTADQAHVHELVQDAMARDKAIDAYEEVARRKFDERIKVRQIQAANVEAQIQALQKQLADFKAETQSDNAQWKQWHDRKIACEKDMAWAIGFLVEGPVVTVDQDHE